MIVRAIAVLLLAASFASLSTAARALSADDVNAASWRPLESSSNKTPDAMIVKAQALLDRRGLSPGVIDGHDGENFRKALTVFSQNRRTG